MDTIEGIPSLWDDNKAKGMSEPELLLYRSNLLGADLRVTNYGGGNTSAKIASKDPLTGEIVTVLWVKGSGGDLGTLTETGLAIAERAGEVSPSSDGFFALPSGAT